ncbi:MAG TPA: hypothetical protein VLB51_15460 [Methylomirabilota bacterium]|nr:hypothetical protein [Methylomirabilota bacterium]
MSTLLSRVLRVAFAPLALWLAPMVVSAQTGTGPGPAAGQGATTLSTFETEDFSGAGVCATCHSRLKDSVGNDVSNDAHWRSTMMANAAKDPLWQAKISSEVARAPHVKEVIEDKCTRCHMGMARYQAITHGSAVEVLGPGFLDPAHSLHEAAMDGVSCCLCHQVQPTGLGTPSSFTGGYEIDTSTWPPDRTIFGPYQDPLRNAMRQAAGFDPALGAQIEDPAHCGSCHTLYTPVLDAGGNPVPVDPYFPEQTTYLEWEHSGFPATCQDCHLPLAVGAVVISNRPPRLAAREPFWQHHFAGGNCFVLELLKANAADLGVTAEAWQLDDTISRTRSQLLNDTAALTVEADLGVDLRVMVDVVNRTGHKLPSGLPSRRAWLHLRVTDGDGALVFESGRPTGDGRIEGNAADSDPATFEPHHTEITSPDQVQIYEPIMLTYEGDVTQTLLRAHSYAKDNRLLPAGFDKAAATGTDVGVYGSADADDDFQGGADRVVYLVDVTGFAAPLTVTAELLFQSLSYPFVMDLAATDTDLVNRFMGMYDPAANTPELLARGQITVP